MNDFISQYQYVIAWTVYILSGLGFSLFWWHITSKLRHPGWRDLLRGVSLVMMFTPWFTDTSHEHMAPAIFVLMMDVLLGSNDNGLAAALTLLTSLALMLVVLVARRFILARRAP